jgi:hypothetical protein
MEGSAILWLFETQNAWRDGLAAVLAAALFVAAGGFSRKAPVWGAAMGLGLATWQLVGRYATYIYQWPTWVACAAGGAIGGLIGRALLSCVAWRAARWGKRARHKT